MLMAKTTTRTAAKRGAKKAKVTEKDSTYLLKLILYMLVGTFWIRVLPESGGVIPIPFGFIVGLMFATHDHFKIDRKIEFAILVIAGAVGLVTGYGLNIYLY